ncbi:MAG: hypothetical protein M0Q95_00190 [Porticoccaceae bacterium]|nr:hypothetical protein [Porticoccaceae bacterium]
MLGFDNRLLPYNSDMVQPYLMLQDFFGDVSTVFSWYYSPALYAFPDWFFAALLVFLPVKNSILPLLYSALLLTLYTLGGALLMARATAFRVLPLMWILTLLLCASAAAPLLISDAILSYQLVISLLSPYIHTGALVIAVFSAGILIHLLVGDGARNSLWALLLLVFITVFSDAIFVVWFVAPAIAVAALYGWGAKNRAGISCALYLLATALAAMACEFMLRDKASLAAVHASGSLRLFFSDFIREAGKGDIPLLLIAILNGVVAVRALLVAGRLLMRKAVTSAMLVELFLGLLCAATILAPLIMGLYRGLALWRYFLPLFLVPPLWLLLCLCSLCSLPSLRLFSGISGGLVVCVVALMYTGSVETVASVSRPSTLGSCLKAEGRDEGYGDYWHTKSLMFATDRSVHIIQLTKEAALPFRFNYNESWFRFRADNGETLKPNFVLMKNIDAGQVREKFGRPDRVLRCGDEEVWLYDQTLPLPLPKKIIASQGRNIELPASELPGSGVVVGQSRIAEQAIVPAGALTYGPYANFSRGSYRIGIHYSAIGKGHGWDIIADQGAAVVAGGTLPASSGQPSQQWVDLVLSHGLSDVEIRTFFGGQGRLEIHAIDIIPVTQ